jgi:hypothetical protein
VASNLQIIINGIDNASGAFSDVGDAMDGLTGKSKGLLSAGLGPLQSMLGTGLKVAAGAAATAVGLLGAGLASSISDAADFQQGMADIQASMGASAEDTAKLKDLILDLGIDPKLKVSAEEAAQAIGQLGGAWIMKSDERVKEDKRKIGKLEGQNIYEFRYKGDPTKRKHVGVMAQEVEKARPDVVRKDSKGVRSVNYGKLFKAGVA